MSARRLATWPQVRISILVPPMLRVLLTNDDGIHADGLQALRRALVALEDVSWP